MSDPLKRFPRRHDPGPALAISACASAAIAMAALASCSSQPAEPGEQLVLDGKLETLVWIAYAPTSFDPTLAVFPDTANIRADLVLLHSRGFDGLITYGADGTLAAVPRIAAGVGFKGVIMGVFMGTPEQLAEELPNAIAAAEFVDAYAVGNEELIGCGGSAYTKAQLQSVMQQLRDATAKPVSTSEQVGDYIDECLDGFLLRAGEWLFPNVHPFFTGSSDPELGADFTLMQFQTLGERTEKPVLIKETGWPTCGRSDATEENQEQYFVRLRDRPVRFAYFEAFDQPWKGTPSAPWESCWGLLQSNRTSKRFIAVHEP